MHRSSKNTRRGGRKATPLIPSRRRKQVGGIQTRLRGQGYNRRDHTYAAAAADAKATRAKRPPPLPPPPKHISLSCLASPPDRENKRSTLIQHDSISIDERQKRDLQRQKNQAVRWRTFSKCSQGKKSQKSNPLLVLIQNKACPRLVTLLNLLLSCC